MKYVYVITQQGGVCLKYICTMPEGMQCLRVSLYMSGKSQHAVLKQIYFPLCIRSFQFIFFTKMLVILFFSFDTKQPKHNQFIMATAQNIYLLTFSYFTNINHPSTLFLQFYKSNYKHPWYNLEIKEADQGYTTVSSIDFNQLKYS